MENAKAIQEKNLELILEPYIKGEIDKDLVRLSTFTQLSSFVRNFYIPNLLVCHVIKNKNGYALLKNNKKYYFELLSDKIEYKADKKILLDYDERVKKNIIRSLRLACSKDLVDANLIVASTNFGLSFLIEYREKGNLKIIDYSNNIIMNKDEYIELYNLEELNRIDQSTLYKIFNLIKEDYFDIFDSYYMYFFDKEMFKELGRNSKLEIFKKYDCDGINLNNFFWFGDNCDCIFFQEYDYFENPITSAIRQFTSNPVCDNVKFFYDEERNSYYYLNNKEKIYFKLISDYIDNKEVKEELLSDNRYGKCHTASIKVLFGMKNANKKYLVNGRIKINEKDYFYHTWMEMEISNNKTIVFDYVSNLIMDKEDYYRLERAEAINRTEPDDLIKLFKLANGYELNMHDMVLGYFSQEFTKDLEKNKFLIKEKRD